MRPGWLLTFFRRSLVARNKALKLHVRSGAFGKGYKRVKMTWPFRPLSPCPELPADSE